jgi:phage portal protein BeeE
MYIYTYICIYRVQYLLEQLDHVSVIRRTWIDQKNILKAEINALYTVNKNLRKNNSNDEKNDEESRNRDYFKQTENTFLTDFTDRNNENPDTYPDTGERDLSGIYIPECKYKNIVERT